jgi:hypothetical protein
VSPYLKESDFIMEKYLDALGRVHTHTVPSGLPELIYGAMLQAAALEYATEKVPDWRISTAKRMEWERARQGFLNAK